MDQRQIGQNIYVEFYGEAVVDQGGPKREFFTGRYIIVEYFIISDQCFQSIHPPPPLPLKTPENTFGFLVFSRVINWEYWSKIVKLHFSGLLKKRKN